MNTIAPVKTHPVIIDVNSIAKVIDHEGLDKNSNGTESDKKSQDSSIEKQGVSIVKLVNKLAPIHIPTFLVSSFVD